MEFDNKQILIQDLPDFTETDPEKLDKEYMWVMFLTRSIFSTIIITGLIIAAVYIRSGEFFILKIIAITLISGIFILYTITAKKAFNRKSYIVRQKDIIYKSGLMFNSITAIPFNRIQHIEVTTGPIEKIFRLCSLKIYTAGGMQSDITIPGLNFEKAAKIKSFVISKTSGNGPQ